MRLLQRPFEQRIIYQKRRFLHEFESFRRFNQESMRAYVQRFRRVQRSLLAVGVDISGTFDSDSLGSRLLDRSGLSHHDQRMILVGTQQSLSFEAIAECLVLQWPEFRPAPAVMSGSGKGKGKSLTSSSSTSSSTTTSSFTKGGSKGPPRRQTYLTEVPEMEVAEDEEFADAQEDPECDADGDAEPSNGDDAEGDPQEDEPDLSELAEVLTVTARKLSGITLGRKFSNSAGGKTKKLPEELRKTTHCSACGASGHWYQDYVHSIQELVEEKLEESPAKDQRDPRPPIVQQVTTKSPLTPCPSCSTTSMGRWRLGRPRMSLVQLSPSTWSIASPTRSMRSRTIPRTGSLLVLWFWIRHAKGLVVEPFGIGTTKSFWETTL